MNNYAKQDASVRKRDLADKSSAIIAIGLVVLSLLVNTFFKDRTQIVKPIQEIRFPAYETEIEEINTAMPFVVNIKLGEDWQLSMEGDSSVFTQVKLYNPYYIYSGDKCIGYIGFNIFTPPAEDTDIMTYHQNVWPVMDSGTMELSNYTIVRLTEKFEAGYCKLSDENITSDAVLCFNKDIHTMAGIVLTEGAVDENMLKQLCLSLSFSAM
ncbi:MAG: hypothetical protein IKJ05_09180 [Oscillospiraceae bacterium]|nr:hypothetical protein [Oscillospiraceae bacterium]